SEDPASRESAHRFIFFVAVRGRTWFRVRQMSHYWLPPLKRPLHAAFLRARSNSGFTRFFQHESEVCLVEKFGPGFAAGSNWSTSSGGDSRLASLTQRD